MSPKHIHTLPEECWEYVLKFLNQPPQQHQQHYLEPVSLVSKQFLSITNRLRSSFAIKDDHPDSFLRRLFHRFPNLTSLDLTRFHGDLDALLLQISRSPLPCLTSLSLSHSKTFPADGLRALAEKAAKTLTSLTCYHVGSPATSDLHLIADCFPSLQELDLTFPDKVHGNRLRVQAVQPLPLALPKLLRKVNLYGESFFINNAELISLCKNCEFLEELAIFKCPLLTQSGIASAIRERPGLRSFSVDLTMPSVVASFIDSLVSLKTLACLVFKDSCISDELLCSVAEEGLPLRKLILDHCSNYTYAGISCLLSKCKFVQHLDLQNAEFLNDQLLAELSVFLGNLISIHIGRCEILSDSALVALIRNCPSLSEIKMEKTGMGKNGVESSNSSMELVVNPQVKFVDLAWNPYLGDETIKMLSLVCPNLQVLDLKCCSTLSEGSVVEVLRKCCKIRHLSLGYCSRMKLHGMNFEVPNVEVLSLAYSGIDDETLTVISKNFCELLYLDLGNCPLVTANGVKKVVTKCKQLREINLRGCKKVAGSVVAWMVSSRPTLRKIVAPPRFQPKASQSELFLRHGCIVHMPVFC